MTFCPSPQHLVVAREANEDDGTDLYEFWVLRAWTWHSDVDDPPLSVYVAKWKGSRDTGKDALPIPDHRASGECLWSEAPEEIRVAFRDEAMDIHDSVFGFDDVFDGDDDGD